MRALFELARDPFVTYAAEWMLAFAIQSTVFLAVVLLIERLAAKQIHPAERHRQLVFSLFALPLLPYAGRLLAPLKLTAFNPTLPVAQHVEPVSIMHVSEFSRPMSLQLASTRDIVHVVPTVVQQSGQAWTDGVALLALVVYAAGVIWFGVRLLYGMARVQRLVWNSLPLQDKHWATFEAAISLPARVRIRVSEELPSPILAGWFRPAIIIPAKLFRTGSVQEIQFAIEHELAHYRRHDTRTKLLVAMLRALLWPQPLVWALAQRVSLLAEQACDAQVTQNHASPLPYAEFLARVGAEPAYAGASAALSHHSSQLLPRIQLLLNARRPIMSPKRTLMLLSSVAAVLLLSSALVATPIVDTTNATDIPAELAEPAPPADFVVPDTPDTQPAEESPPALPAPDTVPEPADPAAWTIELGDLDVDTVGIDSINVFYTTEGEVIKVMKATGDNTILIVDDLFEDSLSGTVERFGDLLVAVTDTTGHRILRAYVDGDTLITGEALRLAIRGERGDRRVERIVVRPDREGRVFFIDEDGDTLLYRVREARHFVRHAVK